MPRGELQVDLAYFKDTNCQDLVHAGMPCSTNSIIWLILTATCTQASEGIFYSSWLTDVSDV